MDLGHEDQDNNPSNVEYEVYVFDERIGSERVHTFYSLAAAEAFLARQPSWAMAHM